jgi:hypothetical protein
MELDHLQEDLHKRKKKLHTQSAIFDDNRITALSASYVASCSNAKILSKEFRLTSIPTSTDTFLRFFLPYTTLFSALLFVSVPL